MSDELQQLRERLAMVETDIVRLRDNYLAVNQRYSETLESLKSLTRHSAETGKLWMI